MDIDEKILMMNLFLVKINTQNIELFFLNILWKYKIKKQKLEK